jgi:hypothetical protein
MRIRTAAVLVASILLLSALPTGVASAALPSLDVADVVVTEPSGRSGTATIVVPLVLGAPAPGPVTVSYRTVAGSAGTSDFVAASGTLTLPAGSQGGGLSLGVRADRTSEAIEHFMVELTGVTGALTADGTGRVDIRDAATGLAVADLTVMEPDAGAVDLGVTVTVPSAPSKPVTFAWQLRSGTATVGSDVVATSGTGTIAKGSLSSILYVRVPGDLVVEGSEWFEIIVDGVKNVALADGIGRVTLLERDVPPPTPTPTPTPTAVPTPTPTAVPTPTPTASPVDPLGGWEPAPGAIPTAGTVVHLESTAGDHIGQGARFTYTQATALAAFDAAGDRFSVHIRGDESWDGWFFPQAGGASLAPGAWTGLPRFLGSTPGLSWSGEGRGCNQSVGTLVIDAWEGSEYDPQRFVARFEQRCDGSAGVLRGYLRYERDDPTAPPPPGDPADFAWTPPDGAIPATGDVLYFESPPGEYIGQGRTDLYTPPTATIRVTETSGVIRMTVERGTGSWWTIQVSGPDAQSQLAAGLYEGLGRYPFHNPVEGGLSMSGEGRGCNELAGTVAVDAVAYDAAGLTSFSIRFEQRCEGSGPPLSGAIRWSRPAS